MDLFKKAFVAITLLLSVQLHAQLTKSEINRAASLKAHLITLAKKSQRQPLSGILAKSVQSTMIQLDRLDKKDPKAHIMEKARALEKTIKYEAPSAPIIKEKPKETEEKPPVQKQDKKVDLITLLNNQLALLSSGQQGIWVNGTPATTWTESVLNLLRNPEFMNFLPQERLQLLTLFFDHIATQYNASIWQHAKNEEDNKIELLKKTKELYLQKMINAILIDIYAHQLYQPGQFWKPDTLQIEDAWIKETSMFLCQILHFNFSNERTENLKTILDNIVRRKYEIEKVSQSMEKEKTVEAMTNSLNKCKQKLQQKEKELEEPLKKAEQDFTDFMKIVKSAPGKEKTQEVRMKREADAIKFAEQWLNVASTDQTTEIASKIESLYKEALEAQVNPKNWFQKWMSKAEDVSLLLQKFNAQINKIVEQRITQQSQKEEQSLQKEKKQPEIEQQQTKEAKEENEHGVIDAYLATIKKPESWNKDSATVSDDWMDGLLALYKKNPELFISEQLRGQLITLLQELPDDFPVKNINKQDVNSQIAEYIGSELSPQ